MQGQISKQASNWIWLAWAGIFLVLVVGVALILTGRLAPKALDASPTARPLALAANGATAREDSNIRGGPGTNYPIVATVHAGGRLLVSGKTDTGNWYQLHDGGWILGELVDVPDASTLPIVSYQPGNYTGLGLSRAAFETAYGAEPFNVSFASGGDVDGQPQVLGRTANGLAIVRLVGPAPDLTEASVTLIGSKDDLAKNLTNVSAMVKLLDTVVPNWTSPAEWLTANLQKALDQGEVKTVHGKYLVSLSAPKDLDTLVLTVKPAAP